MSDIVPSHLETLASKLELWIRHHKAHEGLDDRKMLAVKLATLFSTADSSAFEALHEAFIVERDTVIGMAYADMEDAETKAVKLLLPIFQGFLPRFETEFKVAEAAYNAMTKEERVSAFDNVDHLCVLYYTLEHTISRMLSWAPPPSAVFGGGGGGATEPVDDEPVDDRSIDDEPDDCPYCRESDYSCRCGQDSEDEASRCLFGCGSVGGCTCGE